MTAARLVNERDRIEASLIENRIDPTHVACQGYHPRRPHVSATHVVLLDDGHIERWCKRCVYGLDGIHVIEKFPIRRDTIRAGSSKPEVEKP